MNDKSRLRDNSKLVPKDRLLKRTKEGYPCLSVTGYDPGLGAQVVLCAADPETLHVLWARVFGMLPLNPEGIQRIVIGKQK